MRIILTCLLIFLLSCTLLKKKDQLEIVEMSSSGEIVTNTGEKAKIERHILIVYNDKYRLYVSPIRRSRYDSSLDSSGKPVMAKPIYDTVYAAYAFVENAKTGLEYDLTRADFGASKKIDVDSTLERLKYSKSSFEAFNDELGKPIEVVNNGKKVVEKYVKKKAGLLDADSVFRYYDKDLKDVKFTFSPNFDALNKSKLYKILYIFNPIPKWVAADFELPRREIFYQFKVIHDKDSAQYQKIIERFKLDSKTKLAAVAIQ